MLKIRTKLGLGIGTLLALCVAIGLVSYTQTQVVSEKVKEITEVKEPVNSAVHGLENNLVETAFGALGYLSTGDQTLLEAFRRNRENFEQTQRRYIEVADIENDKEVITRLQQGFARFQAVASEQIALRDLQRLNMEALLKDLDAIDGLLTGRIQSSIKADDPLAYRRLQAALEMEVQANAIMKGLGNFLLTKQSQFESRIHRAEREFKKYFRVYQVVLLSDEEKQWAAELRRLSDESVELATVIIDLEKQKMQKSTEFTSLYRELGSVLNDRIKARTESGLAKAKEDVLQAGREANARILFVLFFGVGFVICAGVVTTRNITRPLKELASVMTAIAHGDRARRVDLKSSDELRTLGEAFNLMTGQLVRANEGLRAEIAERKKTEEELKESEQQRSTSLRRFALSVQRAQEEERERISRELHDDLCQRLSGMKFRVEVLEDEIRPVNKKVSRGLRDFKQELDKTIIEVRRISSNLRPDVLDDFGLVTALKLLCKEFEKLHKVRAAFQLDNTVPEHMDSNIEIALYRIAQEALANIAKHASATTATVHLLHRNSSIQLIVEDDGKGFNQEDTMRAKGTGHGLGFITMKERSELLGGSFELDSVPSKGTTISVTIPLGARDS